jgi:hypothetical protein
MKQVTKEQLYAVISPRDVSLDSGPTATVFSDRYGGIVGKTSGYRHPEQRTYWLRSDLA